MANDQYFAGNAKKGDYEQSLEEILLKLESEKFLRVGTKLDLVGDEGYSTSSFKADNLMRRYDILISTSKNMNIEKLKELIFSKANPELKKIHDTNAVSINTRQADLLRQCINELKKAINAAQDNLAHDFWTIDLKAAIARLGEITGDDLNEEILDNMFSQFCIGK
jgi:tRNA U34 5-carboxymethylaminomethyl modifying GTPase MnmE/TrmE